jgi:hypothetical protein
MTEIGTIVVTRLEMTIADYRDSTKCITISRVGGVQTEQTWRWSRETEQAQIRDRNNSPNPNLRMKVSPVNNPSDVSLQLLLESCLQGRDANRYQGPKRRYVYIWQCVSYWPMAQPSFIEPDERPNSVHAAVQASISWPLRVRNVVFQDAHIAIQRKCSCGRIEDWIYIVMGCPQTLEETNITPQTNSRPELEHRYKFRITCSLDFRLRAVRISLLSYQYRRGGLQCRLGNKDPAGNLPAKNSTSKPAAVLFICSKPFKKLTLLPSRPGLGLEQMCI